MKKNPVSIKNIADALKISVTTVSFVLNGKAEEKHISKATTKKVQDYAAKINYRPNQIAQSLRTGKSNILVFMVEDISNNFFAKLARIIEDIAYEKGYKVIFCSNENDDERSIELINLFKLRQVDGFVIVPSPGIMSTIEMLLEENIPVVLLDRYFPKLNCNSVIINNEEASFDATVHLIENDYKNIGFITTDTDQTQMRDRLDGYKKAVKKFNYSANILSIPYNQTDTQEGVRLIQDFVKSTTSLDAIFFATNYLALKGLELLKEAGCNRELGIVAFDDSDFFKICTPTVTAVAQPLYKLGEELMNIMLDLLKNKEVNDTPKKVTLKAELQIRESSKTRLLKKLATEARQLH